MTCRAINALPAVVGAWQYPGGGLLSSASGSKFIGKDVMQQAHVHAPAKRLMPMIKLGEMLINPEGTKVHSLYIFSSNPAITAPDQNVDVYKRQDQCKVVLCSRSKAASNAFFLW